MLRNKLNELGALAIDFLMRCLAAAWELAWLNRRMTAKGIVSAAVFLAARYGFEISPDSQAALVVVITLHLGLAGRDKQQRRTL